jgi:hypothetical protein
VAAQKAPHAAKSQAFSASSVSRGNVGSAILLFVVEESVRAVERRTPCVFVARADTI